MDHKQEVFVLLMILLKAYLTINERLSFPNIGNPDEISLLDFAKEI
jgi:hypothetical protein